MAAVNNNLGSLLANTYATPPITNASGLDENSTFTSIASCAIPTSATDSAGSTYRMCRVSSSDRPINVIFGSTALTAGAISVGLYLPNDGAVAVANADHLFATSINCGSAVVQVDERFTNLAQSTVGQRVWQLLGLSADPLLEYDLAYTSTTAATAAGTLTCVYVASR